MRAAHRLSHRVGLIGYPIKHSLSPYFQQAALDFHGVPARYEAWETPPDRLDAMIASLREGRCLGANVTVPHKQAVIPLLDAVDPIARRIGAVNTIVNQDGRLAGHNTDSPGFREAVERVAGYQLAEKRALLLGAGGAACAVAFALLGAGVASLSIANRNLERATALCAELREQSNTVVQAVANEGEALDAAAAACDLLINATSVGMRHTATEANLPVPARVLRKGMLVCDLVYNPRQTCLLIAAAQAGASVLDGLPMLIYQGAASFELWTGREAPVGLMFERAKAALEVGG